MFCKDLQNFDRKMQFTELSCFCNEFMFMFMVVKRAHRRIKATKTILLEQIITASIKRLFKWNKTIMIIHRRQWSKNVSNIDLNSFFWYIRCDENFLHFKKCLSVTIALGLNRIIHELTLHDTLHTMRAPYCLFDMLTKHFIETLVKSSQISLIFPHTQS